MFTAVFMLLFMIVLFQAFVGAVLPIFAWLALASLSLLVLKGFLELKNTRKLTKEIERYVQGNGNHFITLIERNKVLDEKKLRYTLSFSFYEEIDSYIEEHLKFIMIEHCSSIKVTRKLLFVILNKEFNKTPPFGKEAVNHELKFIGEDLISNYYCGKEISNN